jgi:hypothetical protein
MSAVDGLFIILSGAVVVSGLLASDDVDGADEVDDGGDEELELLEVDDGGEAGLIVALDDDVDDVVSVLGAGLVADFDGATTGGVVDVVVFDSRWQPATPSAMPVQSRVTRAALLIVISRSG